MPDPALQAQDIGEAITMADRIIVMTHRPARIRAIHPVGAAARDPVTMRETPEFQQLFQTIWGELQEGRRLMPLLPVGDGGIWWEEQGAGPPLMMVAGLGGVVPGWPIEAQACEQAPNRDPAFAAFFCVRPMRWTRCQRGPT